MVEICGEIPLSPAWSYCIMSHIVILSIHVNIIVLYIGQTTLEQRTCFSLMYFVPWTMETYSPTCLNNWQHVFYNDPYSGPPYTIYYIYTAISSFATSKMAGQRSQRSGQGHQRQRLEGCALTSVETQWTVRVLKFVKAFQAVHFQSWDTVVCCSILEYILVWSTMIYCKVDRQLRQIGRKIGR